MKADHRKTQNADPEIKWTKFLSLSLLAFLSFMLEYFSLFVIEAWLLHVDIWNYTAQDRSIHCVIMAVLWAVYIGILLSYSKKQLHFPSKGNKKDRVSFRNWSIALLCLIGCKIIIFLDWHTLKIIGEFQGKTISQFLAQYLYYIFEIMLVLLIIVYGQKAAETRLNSQIPFGGIILALTWGIFHFVSRGAGLEIWNGISTVIFSILSGVIYLKLGKSWVYSYLFIAAGYLL